MRAIALALAAHAVFFAVLFRITSGTATDIHGETLSISVLEPKASAPARKLPVAPPARENTPNAASETIRERVAAAEAGPTQDSANYLSLLRAKIQERAHYTSDIARRHLEGKVVVEISISPTGTLGTLGVQTSSGHAELDRLALQAVQDSFPFVPPPSKSSISAELPVEFKLH